jgi:hypothetical protein
MNFTQRKLPREAAEKLRICPIHTVSPYALMLGPVYVFMKLNEKFVAVKGPMDFFTPEELQKLAPMESFFFTEFVDHSLNFRQTARACRALMVWNPQPSIAQVGESSYPEVPVPPSSFELSDALLRLIGPLWSASPQGPAIEPFFVAVFVNELCEPLPPEMLVQAREQDVLKYEHSILLSSWAVFLAIHLGHCDLAFLNALRVDAFRESGIESGIHLKSGTLGELMNLASRTIRDQDYAKLSQGLIVELEAKSRNGAKLASRLKRVQEKFLKADGSAPQAPTIHGEKGFVDV